MLRSPRLSLLFRFSNHNVVYYVVSPIRATSLAHIILLDFINPSNVFSE
jgi:hypothetical protein